LSREKIRDSFPTFRKIFTIWKIKKKIVLRKPWTRGGYWGPPKKKAGPFLDLPASLIGI
jgi:hypothetical protein